MTNPPSLRPPLPHSIELTNCRYAAGPNITKLIIAPLALHSGHFGRHPVGCACKEGAKFQIDFDGSGPKMYAILIILFDLRPIPAADLAIFDCSVCFSSLVA